MEEAVEGVRTAVMPLAVVWTAADAWFQAQAEALGAPVDLLKYVACLLALVPVGFLFARLPRATPAVMKHLFSIVVSIGMATFCLGPTAWIHSFTAALGTWLLMHVVPSRKLPAVVMLWALGYLSAGHIYRMYTDYLGWSLDYTGPQMVLTIKLTSFAFCYSDGQQLEAIKAAPEPWMARRARYAVVKKPGLLEFLGYSYFFTTFLAGPSFEFRTYQQYINGSLFEAEKGIPSTVMPTIWVFCKVLAVTPLAVLYMTHMDVAFLLTDRWLAMSLLEKLFWLWICSCCIRYKYYLGWFLAELSCAACGLSYNGRDKAGAIRWDRMTNVFPLGIEAGQNTHLVLSSWNVCTHHWLKNYVYLRLVPSSGKAGLRVTVATFAVSAFWHGFYPGYYIFFVFLALTQEVAREVRRRFRPLFVVRDGKTETAKPTKVVYDVVSALATSTSVAYIGVAFILLSWESALHVFNNTYWIGCIAILTALIFLKATRKPPARAKSAKEE